MTRWPRCRGSTASTCWARAPKRTPWRPAGRSRAGAAAATCRPPASPICRTRWPASCAEKSPRLLDEWGLDRPRGPGYVRARLAPGWARRAGLGRPGSRSGGSSSGDCGCNGSDRQSGGAAQVRRLTTIGVALALVAGGGSALAAASGGRARPATGGLSISPAVVEQPARAGAIGPLTVSNRSGAPLKVTVAARPWSQARDGKVSVDRRHELPGVTVAQPAFTLAPGQSQVVSAALTGTPSGGSLYGALEVIGLPEDADTRQGVVLGYRLIGTLRLAPATRRHELAGTLSAHGRSVALDLRNLGNTVDPVSGSARVRDARGTRSPGISTLRVLPGGQVHLVLAKGLSSGRVNASVTLSQAGRRTLVLKRKLNVR